MGGKRSLTGAGFNGLFPAQEGPMKQTYRWAMQNAAPTLFVIAAVLFLIGVGQALLSLKNTVGEAVFVGQPVGQGVAQWLMFLTGTFTAISSAVLPFAAAAALYRWDRHAN
jgi:hypothetical protein